MFLTKTSKQVGAPKVPDHDVTIFQRHTVFLSFQGKLHVTLYLGELALHTKQCRLARVNSVRLELELASISIELELTQTNKGPAVSCFRFNLFSLLLDGSVFPEHQANHSCQQCIKTMADV